MSTDTANTLTDRLFETLNEYKETTRELLKNLKESQAAAQELLQVAKEQSAIIDSLTAECEQLKAKIEADRRAQNDERRGELRARTWGR